MESQRRLSTEDCNCTLALSYIDSVCHNTHESICSNTTVGIVNSNLFAFIIEIFKGKKYILSGLHEILRRIISQEITVFSLCGDGFLARLFGNRSLKKSFCMNSWIYGWFWIFSLVGWIRARITESLLVCLRFTSPLIVCYVN